MLKRQSMGSRDENYEHVLMCLICRSLFDDHDHQPKFLPCHHTFCKECLREYVRQVGDDIECPSCRKHAIIPAAGVSALQTNFYVKYIQSLVHGISVSGGGQDCAKHSSCKLSYYCSDCMVSVCDKCIQGDGGETTCANHKKIPITNITEECHQTLDSAFSKANTLIEAKKVELEAILKGFSQEKDEALKKIDSSFEQHVHTLNRRATLLKNKVIDIYNEHEQKLEADLEEVSTAMTCIVSIKEHQENNITKGSFHEFDLGVHDIKEVADNISTRIKPQENHIVFEDRHGVEKYRTATKDLGRVRSHRPTIQRVEPDGKDINDMSVPNTPASEGDNSPIGGATSASGSSITTPVLNGSSSSNAQKDCDNNNPNASINTLHCMHMSMKEKNDNIVDEKNTSCNNNKCQDLYKPPSDLLITGDGAVRPKTLETSTNKKKPRSHDIGRPTKGIKTNHMIRSLPAKLQAQLMAESQHDPNFLSVSVGGAPQLHPSDPHLRSHSSHDLQQPMTTSMEAELLKATDKMYHHLVYTSYDEEELLKELKNGKVSIDQVRTQTSCTSSSQISSDCYGSTGDSPVVDDPFTQSTL